MPNTNPKPIQEDQPAASDTEEHIAVAHAKYREEYADVAEKLQERLPDGYRVTYGKMWKGYGLSVRLPDKDRQSE